MPVLVCAAHQTDPPPSGSSFNIEVDGKQLHRVIWDLAMRHTQDGVLDVDEAKDLWETIVKDDKQVTTCQLTTLDMVLHKKHCSHNAIAFLMEKFEQVFAESAVCTCGFMQCEWLSKKIWSDWDSLFI